MQIKYIANKNANKKFVFSVGANKTAKIRAKNY